MRPFADAGQTDFSGKAIDGTFVMMMRHALLSKFAALSLAFLAVTALSFAQGSNLTVDAAIGFGGLFRAGSWTPVYLTVGNLGQSVEGTLSVSVQRGARFGENRTTVTYQRELELVSGGTKAFSFVLPLQTTVYPVRISVHDGEETILAEDYDLSGRSVPGTFVLALSRRPYLDFLLPLFNSETDRALDVAYPLVEFLPEQWHGYDGVDVIVVHDARLAELDERQRLALRDWTAAGGRLVVSAGTHFGPADAEAIAPLGDYTPMGIEVAPVETVGLLEAGLPVSPDERDAEVAVTLFPDGRSAVQRIPFGQGDVILLPFDYSNFVRVAPLTSVALWNSILEGAPSPSGVPTELRRRVFEVDLLANQLALPVYEFPSRLLLGGLLASYLVALLSLLYWIKSGSDRLRRFLGVPALIAAVALVGVAGHLALTVSMQPDESLFLSIERVQLREDQEYATVTRDSVLFTRGQGEYRVTHPGNPLIVPLDDHNQRVASSPKSLSAVLETGRWGYRNALAMDILPLAISLRTESAETYSTFIITNDSELYLSSAVVLINGFPYEVGPVPPGSSSEAIRQGEYPERFADIDWLSFAPEGALSKHRARLIGDLARDQHFSEDGDQRALLVAWPDAELLPVSLSAEFHQDIRLSVVTVAAEVEDADGL